MDKHTPEQRRKNMQAVKNKDSQIELMLRKELWSRGLRYRKNSNKVFGHPDIVFIGKKVAVFCDSEFWHGHDWENRKKDFKSHQEFWIPKIERNMQRDMQTLTDNEDFLTDKLSGEEKKRFIQYVDAWASVNGESTLDSFITGFRLGAQFTFDTFVTSKAPYVDYLKDEI